MCCFFPRGLWKPFERLLKSHSWGWALNPLLPNFTFCKLDPERAHYVGIFYIAELVEGLGGGRAVGELWGEISALPL
jgi:hypothetical protein